MTAVKRAVDLIPWKVTDISLRPYKHFWSMNPSIHYDGDLWRCNLRCCDYAMPDGVAIRSRRAEPGESRTKNAMVIFDPVSWEPVEIYKMRERDDLPRDACASVGYEDIRIFRTDRGGLQGIAASLHLRRDVRQRAQLAEQVLLSFDAEYNIAGAAPIRGSWSSLPQKNWAPFDNCAEPRFLHSIGDGVLFDDRGPVDTEGGLVRPALGRLTAEPKPSAGASQRARERARRELERGRKSHEGLGQGKLDQGSYDSDPSRAQRACVDLRGGTQLVRVSDDAWLGIGHAMTFVSDRKLYWHVWYLVDSRGKLMSASPPMKLAPNRIEFAAGMAVVGDRVVVSFGVDDMGCRLGETRLSAVLGALQKIGALR